MVVVILMEEVVRFQLLDCALVGSVCCQRTLHTPMPKTVVLKFIQIQKAIDTTAVIAVSCAQQCFQSYSRKRNMSIPATFVLKFPLYWCSAKSKSVATAQKERLHEHYEKLQPVKYLGNRPASVTQACNGSSD